VSYQLSKLWNDLKSKLNSYSEAQLAQEEDKFKEKLAKIQWTLSHDENGCSKRLIGLVQELSQYSFSYYSQKKRVIESFEESP
jgi:hypothetical protein